MLTDLFFRLQRQRSEHGKVTTRSYAADQERAASSRCEGTWCSGEMVRGAEVGAERRIQRAYRGKCGGNPDTGKEVKIQGG